MPGFRLCSMLDISGPAPVSSSVSCYEPMASDWPRPARSARGFCALPIREPLLHGGTPENAVSAKSPAPGNRVGVASLGDDLSRRLGHELSVLPTTDHQHTLGRPWAVDSRTNCCY